MPTPKLNMSNQQFAERQKAAQQIKAGQAAPATGPAALQQQGAQTGAVAQAAQTQGAIQQAGQQVVDAQKQAQLGQIQKVETQAMEQLAAEKSFADQSRRLAEYARELGNDMMEERRDFEQKGKQTAFNNERQLADWVVANAENEQDFQNRMQEMQQASVEKIQTLEIINNRIMLEEEKLSKAKQSSKTRAMKKKLAIRRKQMQDQIRREKERAQKRGGVFKVLTGVVTAVAGAGMAYAGATTGNVALASMGASTATSGLGQTAAGASEAGVI